MDVFVPDHIHFLATVTLDKPSFTEQGVGDWLRRLVKAADMAILAGPFVCSCSDPGNEGITGVIVLSTSHSSIHIWTHGPVPYLKMDLYSCKRFGIEPVLAMIAELGPRVCEYQIIDRNHTDESNLVRGAMSQIQRGVVDYRKSINRRSPVSPSSLSPILPAVPVVWGSG